MASFGHWQPAISSPVHASRLYCVFAKSNNANDWLTHLFLLPNLRCLTSLKRCPLLNGQEYNEFVTRTILHRPDKKAHIIANSNFPNYISVLLKLQLEMFKLRLKLFLLDVLNTLWRQVQ